MLQNVVEEGMLVNLVIGPWEEMHKKGCGETSSL